jgi:ABC-type nitrate/sulfonate/bicarbonate transport system permease component
MSTLATEAVITAAEQTDRRGRGRGGGRRAASTLLSAAVTLVVLIGIWWAFVVLFHIKPSIGPRPLDVWRYFTSGPTAHTERSLLAHGISTTLRDAFLGLAFGILAAMIGAVLFTLSRVVQQTFMPMAMVLQSVPLVALVPLIAVIFGRGLATVTIISSIVTFFPALVNVTLAARNAPTQSMDLIRAYGGSPVMTLRKVQLPSALPALFASLRIAAPLALIGALLAEWLATNEGIGALMLHAGPQFDYPLIWACVAVVTAFSVVLYGVISAIESAVLARYGPPSS